MTFWKNAFRADVFPVTSCMVLATVMATGHLYKLYTDPHTKPLKSMDETRQWDNSTPSSYMHEEWEKVLGGKKK